MELRIEYDFDIVYRKGSLNINALSRIYKIQNKPLSKSFHEI